MKTESMLIIANWEDREKAERLGLNIPEPVMIKTKMLFWKYDMKRALINKDGNIFIFFNDDHCYEVQYDEELWKEIEEYFMTNEE